MDVLNYKQWFKLNERLGVPDFIQDEGSRIYTNIIDTIKKGKIVRADDNEYISMSSTENVKVGDKIYPNIIHKLRIIDANTDTPKIASLHVKHSWRPKSHGLGFDYKKGENVDTESTDVETLVAADLDMHTIKDILAYLEGPGRSEYISSLSHELMHAYDASKRSSVDLRKSSKYRTASDFKSGVKPIDDFMHFVYFTDAVESTVRASEIASKMKAEGITKGQFLDFLKKDRTWALLKEISNFNVDDMIEEIASNKEYIDKILAIFNHIDYVMKGDKNSPKDIVSEFLNIVYINISNITIEEYERKVNNIVNRNPLAAILDSDRIDIDVNDFRKSITKYRNNPIGFFKSYEKHFKKETNKVMKKLTKLYDMAQDDNIEDKVSIVNRELHQKITGKENSIRDKNLRESLNFDEFIEKSDETKSEE